MIDNVKEYFKQFNLNDKILEFEVSSATVDLAAIALNCEPGRIAKSLSFYGKNNDCVMILTAGDKKIDNRKFKDTFGMKAKMLNFEDVEAFTGHKVGGVCPFAIKENVSVYLDESLKIYEYVYPACGSSNSAIKLTLPELEKYSQNFKSWVDVSKDL